MNVAIISNQLDQDQSGKRNENKSLSQTYRMFKKIVERQVSEPGAGQVRIRVEAKLRRLFRARGYAIGRKKLGISHPKLKEVVHRSF
jgi:hypothetical protein